jgi:hypothetical protein
MDSQRFYNTDVNNNSLFELRCEEVLSDYAEMTEEILEGITIYQEQRKEHTDICLENLRHVMIKWESCNINSSNLATPHSARIDALTQFIGQVLCAQRYFVSHPTSLGRGVPHIFAAAIALQGIVPNEYPPRIRHRVGGYALLHLELILTEWHNMSRLPRSCGRVEEFQNVIQTVKEAVSRDW